MGRLFQQFDASGSDRGSEFHYTPWGQLEKVIETQDSLHTEKIYRAILSVDARGNVLQSLSAAAMTAGHKEVRTYDPTTGRLLTNQVTLVIGTLMQDLTYAWDVMGNLTSRTDHSRKPDGTYRNRTETFQYDAANGSWGATIWMRTVIDLPAIRLDALTRSPRARITSEIWITMDRV